MQLPVTRLHDHVVARDSKSTFISTRPFHSALTAGSGAVTPPLPPEGGTVKVGKQLVAGRRDVRLVVPIRRPREAVPASGAVSHFVVAPPIAAPGRCGKQGRQVMLSSLPTARAYRAGCRQEATNSHADREPSIDAAGGLTTFRPLGGHPFPPARPPHLNEASGGGGAC